MYQIGGYGSVYRHGGSGSKGATAGGGDLALDTGLKFCIFKGHQANIARRIQSGIVYETGHIAAEVITNDLATDTDRV